MTYSLGQQPGWLVWHTLLGLLYASCTLTGLACKVILAVIHRFWHVLKSHWFFAGLSTENSILPR